jgi:homoserine kinase
VCLSGAGPAVLVIVDAQADLADASRAIHDSLIGLPHPQLITSRFEEIGAESSFRQNG